MLMKRVHLVVVSALVVLMVAIGAGQAPSGGAERLNADVFASLKVRNIGPMLVTGRVQDITIDP